MNKMLTDETDAFSTMCRHHWVIETPNGATSHGHCKRCGMDRQFRNSSEEMMWDNDNFSLNGSRGRGRRPAKAPSLS